MVSATMQRVVYIVTAGVLLLVVAIFGVVFAFQRRRRRRAHLLALAAQVEAERRRKKKKRNGLRSSEIDNICPEMIVVPRGSLSAYFSDDEVPDAAGQEQDEKEERLPGDSLKPNMLNRVVAENARPPQLQQQQQVFEVEEPRLSKEVRKVEDALAHKQDPALDDTRARNSADSRTDEKTPDPVEIPEGDEVCVVCLDDMVVDDRVRRLPCSHIYHSSCIRVWLRRKNACPCCCKTVLKRKRRKKKRAGDANHEHLRFGEPPALPALPVEPPRSASFSVLSNAGNVPQTLVQSRSTPVVTQVRAESTVIDINDLNRRGDRPRPPLRPGPAHYGQYVARSGSLLDPEDPASEQLNSEASSQFDEQMAGELLEHVRQVLREELASASFDEYSTDGEFSDACNTNDDDSVYEDTSEAQMQDQEQATGDSLASSGAAGPSRNVVLQRGHGLTSQRADRVDRYPADLDRAIDSV